MKKKNKLTCKTGLKKNVIKKDVFNREISLCRQLAKENKGKCGWGKCKDCGVIPLLYKFHKGKLLEKPAEIKKAKSKIINPSTRDIRLSSVEALRARI